MLVLQNFVLDAEQVIELETEPWIKKTKQKMLMNSLETTNGLSKRGSDFLMCSSSTNAKVVIFVVQKTDVKLFRHLGKNPVVCSIEKNFPHPCHHSDSVHNHMDHTDPHLPMLEKPAHSEKTTPTLMPGPSRETRPKHRKNVP